MNVMSIMSIKLTEEELKEAILQYLIKNKTVSENIIKHLQDSHFDYGWASGEGEEFVVSIDGEVEFHQLG
ncbi:MAG: hypothetical protein A2381_19355 [Bdellovibrionales bacterium RIFOXYB1_FULL_37_110]|nr:MAG: hypothetical protein A2381_19355 [Bdellovibrionales bacterium RIFOXYB1_FULL_37_110]